MATKSSHALAAAAIKKELKAMGIKCKASSESYSMGNSVNITVYDQHYSVFKQIEAICDKYQYGNFNGMEDIYEYTNSRDDLPQAKYVHVKSELSDSFLQVIIDKINARYKTTGTVEQYRKGGLPQLHENGNWNDFQQEIYQTTTGVIDYERDDKRWSREQNVSNELISMGIKYVSEPIYFSDDQWRVGADRDGCFTFNDDYTLTDNAIASLLYVEYQKISAIVLEERAAQAKIEERNATPITPISVNRTKRFLTVVFPSCNKNHHISDNDEEILDSPYSSKCEVHKTIVLTADHYDIVSNSLLNDREYLWEKIGGSYCDDAALKGLTPHSKEYYAKWREHGITPVVEVINQDTQETFFVNSDEFGYARYVGRGDEYIAKLKTDSIISNLLATLH